MGVFDAVVDAYQALLNVTERVYLPGHTFPEGEAPLIRLDPISAVDRGYYRGTSQLTRVQIAVWGRNLDAVFPLSEQARAVMIAAGFRPDGSGPLSDPEGSAVGWRTDYRRQ